MVFIFIQVMDKFFDAFLIMKRFFFSSTFICNFNANSFQEKSGFSESFSKDIERKINYWEDGAVRFERYCRTLSFFFRFLFFECASRFSAICKMLRIPNAVP